MSDPTNEDAGEKYSLARDRSRRSKVDKKGRLAALERLKSVKASGKKSKFEVEELQNVYDEVDENEYSEIVQDRQEDDWIVDDDGSGYVEDGRDVFDEDITDMSSDNKKKKKASQSKKNPNIRPNNSKPSNIRAMFAAAAVKPKKAERNASIKQDDVLDDIMSELHQDSKISTKLLMGNKTMKQPLKTMNPFATPTPPKPVVSKSESKKRAVVKNVPQKKTPLPKRQSSFSAALENLEDVPMEEVEETEATQDVVVDSMEKGGDSVEDMDMSGIDFDDDFEPLEEKTAPVEKKIEKIEQTKSTLSISDSFWDNNTSSTVDDLPRDVSNFNNHLPLYLNEEKQNILKLYWIDAYEDYYKQPGIVYLFGKVPIEDGKSFVSGCVAVKNIERRVFILPRQNNSSTGQSVSLVDVYEEFQKLATNFGINKFKSKKVTKSYAFELEGVPAESEYLEVCYSASCPALSDRSGDTFSHIFGTNTTSLEHFLLDRKLKGPCWLEIKSAELNNPGVTWCKVEASVTRPDYVNVASVQPGIPPLVVMALGVRILPNKKNKQSEIIGVSCLVQHNFYMDRPPPKTLYQQHICAITTPSDSILPVGFKDFIQKKGPNVKIEVTGSERALLGFFLVKLHKIDPDIIVGHDVLGYGLDILLHRINQNKIPHWSKIGRLKRTIMPKLNTHGGSGKLGGSVTATSGRLVCDVMVSGKELIHCRSYDLTEMVGHVLKGQRDAVDFDQARYCFNSSTDLLRLTELTSLDTKYSLSLMYELNAIPLALQITSICGNVLTRTLQGGRSQRNEFLLLHAFNERNFIVPDKSFNKKQKNMPLDEEEMNVEGNKKGRKKPAYAGGLVLEPKKGFYDSYILLLDFNSLYPSIIQEFNICFTTVVRPTITPGEELDEDIYSNLKLPDSDMPTGVLPTEIRKLVQSRRQVKALMKQPDLSKETLMQYDIRQKALKLTANSMYGCLGFTYSRFYAKPLAALVTSKGRELLMKTKELTESLNLEVIYGDTDSIMVNSNSTNLEEVYKIGNKIKTEVNKLHRLVEIEIDGVFKSMLLLKKKKYAALTIQKIGNEIKTGRELKGLDIVRRDWCELAKNAGNYVVDQILSGEPREVIVNNIHKKLTEVTEQVKGHEIPLELYQINKQLTKNPEDYPDKKNFPHVQVALRLNTKGGRKLRGGDTIAYVICQDGSNLSATQRAYHPDELSKNDSLKIDIHYYLSHQVHPVVSRLCDPIEGTDSAHIAECLGLDPKEYRRHIDQSQNDEENEDDVIIKALQQDESRYKDCERLKLICSCGASNIIDSVFTGHGTELNYLLHKCCHTDCHNNLLLPNVVKICNQLTVTIRRHIQQYYIGWLKCEDSACNAVTKRIAGRLVKGRMMCKSCRRSQLDEQYTEAMLYNQLAYYRHVFDIKRARLHLLDIKEKEVAKTIPADVIKAFDTVEQHVSKIIDRSAFSNVNLGRLFENMVNIKNTASK